MDGKKGNKRYQRYQRVIKGIKAVNAIQEGYSEISNFALVRRILFILKSLKQWKIQHIARDDNLIADSLAKSVCSRRLGLRLIEDPPLWS
ncbi:hypothetical protein J1N35_009928 [Gossypium stocksii]|uniref:RNase H type-1 domain-containing protein n=1 Tax=Gossypium stocksii TaxID=47602 RepID=A0A9D3W1G4_9ROSI|nr:hypothetical protein J1N35_009928 [Gossypium stocksii]